MVAKSLSYSPAYAKCLQGLRELHRLAAEGLADSAEADEIRDETDAPWMSLTDEEKKRLEGLSEDLYSITDPVRSEIRPSNPQFDSAVKGMLAARTRGEWDRCFDLLRRWKEYFEPANLSSLRGTALLAAGDPATAALFLEHAAQLDPDSNDHLAIYIETLRRVEPAAASALAEGILRDPENLPAAALAHAVYARLNFAMSLPRDQANRFFESIIPILSAAKSKIAGPERLVYSMICTLLGKSFEFVGKLKDAIANYTDAIRTDPDNDALLVARGILLYGESPGAVEDFRRAIALRTPLAWPYLLLSHHYVMNGLFGQCLVECERALQMPIPDEIKSELSDWLAISQSKLGFPVATIRASFERAIAYDPSNERARRNRDAFESAVQPVPLRTYDTPSSRDVQDWALATRRLEQAA